MRSNARRAETRPGLLSGLEYGSAVEEESLPRGDSGFRTLALTVLSIALTDALGQIPRSQCEFWNRESKSKLEMQADALFWIIRPNRDFNLWCDVAGLAPEAVRQRFLQILRSASIVSSSQVQAIQAGKLRRADMVRKLSTRPAVRLRAGVKPCIGRFPLPHDAGGSRTAAASSR